MVHLPGGHAHYLIFFISSQYTLQPVKLEPGKPTQH